MIFDTFVGIDPGIYGAIAMIDTANHGIKLMDMPYNTFDGKNYIDYYALAVHLNVLSKDNTFCVVEQVWSMPDEGISSAFNFGKNYGVILGIIGANQYSHLLVPGNKWKAYYKLSGKPKKASIPKALTIYPQSQSIVTNHGRADALLLANYAKILKEKQ